MVTERCIRQSALIVRKNVKFHSSLTEPGQFTAENVTEKEDHPEDISLVLHNHLELNFLFSSTFLFYVSLLSVHLGISDFLNYSLLG